MSQPATQSSPDAVAPPTAPQNSTATPLDSSIEIAGSSSTPPPAISPLATEPAGPAHPTPPPRAKWAFWKRSNPLQRQVTPSTMERGATLVSRPPAQYPPPQYDQLPTRLDSFISNTETEGTRQPPPPVARPVRRLDTGASITTECSPTMVNAPHEAGHWLPPPPFGSKEAPDTISRTFFWYGFLFPLFWVLGATVLLVKLKPTPEDQGGKPLAQQQDMLGLYAIEEEKWAFRCLAAFVIFLIIVAVIIFAVVFTVT